MMITDKADILDFRKKMLLIGLTSEIRTGMKLTRGPSAYAIIKREFGLKGSKASVLLQFKALLDK